MCDVLCSPAFARPRSIAQLPRHVFWRVGQFVKSYLVKPKLNSRVVTNSISQPFERRNKSIATLLAGTPEWPVRIGIWPHKVVGVIGGPSDTVICTASGWIASAIAGLLVTGSGKLVKYPLKVRKGAQIILDPFASPIEAMHRSYVDNCWHLLGRTGAVL